MKDPAVLAYSEDELRALQARITDPNFRIFADRDAITVFNNERFVRGTDIQEIFAQLGVDEATHAFYLGKELAKAPASRSRSARPTGRKARCRGAISRRRTTQRSEHVKLTQRSRRRPKAPTEPE